MTNNVRNSWPDLSKDQKAWELAKLAYPNADTQTLVQKAQEFKEALTSR